MLPSKVTEILDFSGTSTMAYPKAIVFDLLTALLDSWTLWEQAAGNSLAGRAWRAQYLELTYGAGRYTPYENLVVQAASDTGLSPSAPAALLNNWDTLKPWPEAPAILDKLQKRGILLGVITNCSIELGRRAALQCGLVFHAVVTAEEAGYYKPRPESYAAVLKALGVQSEDVLFVAGSSADVPGAIDAGMQVVWHNRVGLAIRAGASPRREGRTLQEALQEFL